MNIALYYVSVDKDAAETKLQPPTVLLPRAFTSNRAPDALGQIPLARAGRFWVPTSNLLIPPVKWSQTYSSEHVRLPLFAYRTKDKNLSSVMAVGCQLGLTAFGLLPAAAVTRVRPSEATIVLGDRVHEVDDGYRFYAGFAFCVV